MTNLVAALVGSAGALCAAAAWLSCRRAQAELRKLREEHSILAVVSELHHQIATASDEPSELLALILAQTQSIAGGSAGVVEMIDGDEMVYRAVSGTLSGSAGLRLKMANSLSGLCAREERPQICHDSHEDPRTNRAACEKLGIRSMILVPLRAASSVIGVLKISSSRPSAFGAREVRLLELVGGVIGGAIARADMAQETLRRKRAEALAGNLEALAQAIPQIVWTATPDGHLDYYNQRWFDYTGMTLEQTRGWGWGPVLHPDDLPRCVERWTHAYQTGTPYEIEYRFKRASDGAYRWHLGRAAPMRAADGTILKWFGTCTDIDDQKRNHTLLLESEERYRSVIAASRAMVWTNSGAGEMRGLQPGWAAYTGQSQAEYQGYGWSAAVHSEDREPTVEAWKRAVKSRSLFLFEHRVRGRDGEYRWFSVRAVPMLDAEGGIREWVGVHTDVHDQKLAAEERLQRLTHEKAEAALRETNEKLTAANLALRAGVREKDVLLQEVHHRVKNNLQVISSLLNMQARGLPAGPAREMLKESQGRVRSIALVHEKLYGARDLGSVPMSEYLRDLAGTALRASSVDRGQVALVVDVEQLELSVDRAIPCGLIVNELIANCLKHGFPEGRTGSVRVTLRREDAKLVLGVADDGVGLVGKDPSREGSLGMQIVGTLADQLAGELKLGQGPGASFLVAFPAAA